MQVAYIFNSDGPNAVYKFGRMILPHLEADRHGAEVVGMFFFDDSTYLLRRGDALGERLGAYAREHGMLLMLCDQCATERGIAEDDAGGSYRAVDVVEGVRVGCFFDTLRRAGWLAASLSHHALTVHWRESVRVARAATRALAAA